MVAIVRGDNLLPINKLNEQFVTISTLYKDRLIREVIDPDCSKNIFTFKNQVPTTSVRSPMSQKFFNAIKQYLAMLKSRSYHFLFNDFSLARFHYEFDPEGKLNSYNLLWFPCPFSEKFLKDVGSLTDNIIDYMDELTEDDTFNTNDLLLRTPIRVDYDANYSGRRAEFHPVSHIHFQHHHTRAKNNSIFCLYNFFNFIIENCYPEKYEFLFKTEEVISQSMKNEFRYWLKENKIDNELGNHIYTNIGLG